MKRTSIQFAMALAGALGFAPISTAQPRPRLHRVVERGELDLAPATSTPQYDSKVTIRIFGDQRVIESNGIPNHMTGRFPNPGNPNAIWPQHRVYRVPAEPQRANRVTPIRGSFGIAINGVPFDPGAAEFYGGAGNWQYEPLSGAIELGIDVSHAHVQPTGKYHYHGLPTGLLDSVELAASEHSPIIGWAADGFPIYAVYGYSDPADGASSIQKLASSYQLKKGHRPGGRQPGGKYDGTFVQDYQYVAGSGDLDECNGRFTVTPDYPNGSYAYFLTEQWPVVPRLYRGRPSSDFRHGGAPGAEAGPGQRFAPGRSRRPGRFGRGRQFPGGPPPPGPFLP